MTDPPPFSIGTPRTEALKLRALVKTRKQSSWIILFFMDLVRTHLAHFRLSHVRMGIVHSSSPKDIAHESGFTEVRPLASLR